MSGNFALELFSGIGGMSLGLHSARFESHGFDASERAVAMANESGLASTAVDVFGPEIVETMRRVHPNPVSIHASPPCETTIEGALGVKPTPPCGRCGCDPQSTRENFPRFSEIFRQSDETAARTLLKRHFLAKSVARTGHSCYST